MVPARVRRAAARFRSTYDLPAGSIYKEYVDFHDAMHQFLGAPPTDSGEEITFRAEERLLGKVGKQSPRIENFVKKYGHLYVNLPLHKLKLDF